MDWSGQIVNRHRARTQVPNANARCQDTWTSSRQRHDDYPCFGSHISHSGGDNVADNSRSAYTIPMIDMPPAPPQEQIIERRLVECGLDVRGISVKYEEYLQGIEIVISSNAGATADHFECIEQATGNETVMFENHEMMSAYSDFTSELGRPQMLAIFESRLKERGLWEGLPVRQEFDSLENYVKALEKHAGVAPGSALRVSGDWIHFDPDHEEPNPTVFEQRYSDLLAVIAYVSTLERLKFGIIGNAKISE